MESITNISARGAAGFKKVVISAFLLCALVGVLVSCGGNTEEIPAYESPYNWDYLDEIGGRYYYGEGTKKQSLVGIDVSDHQGQVDWEAVKDDGIEFAFIRIGNRGATEGKLYLDEQFYPNFENAQKVEIPVGVYFFSQAINEKEAIEEAEFVLEHLGGHKLDYPVVYDHEPVSGIDGRANKLSREQLNANAKAFCQLIEKSGYKTMIYGNSQDISKLDNSVFDGREVWFAEYDSEIPTGQFDFVIWQYANDGSVAGIATNVDMNIHFLEP